MSTEIRYFTKSKKGNTEKLAQTIANAVKLPALDVTHDLNAKVDRLFLVNAMYAADIDKEVKAFLTRNRDKIGEVVNFCTSASGKSTTAVLKKTAGALQIPVNDKDFHCAASWIFINKGLPSADDFQKAADFARSMKK